MVTAPIKQPGLDNHAMGTIFEELIRRFNEENNEEAGEHWTPRDAVKLMANLIFLPIAKRLNRVLIYFMTAPAAPVGCSLWLRKPSRTWHVEWKAGNHPSIRAGN